MSALSMKGTLFPVADSTDREAWLEIRRTGVTATDVAKIGSGGAGAFRSVLRDKRGELADFRNRFMEHGSEREAAIAAWVELKFTIAPSSTLFAHRDNPRYLATPDGVSKDFAFSGELAEIKTTKNEWDGPSAFYTRQMQWQMFVTGADYTYFVWEQHDDNWQPMDLEPHYVGVRRDQAMIDDLREKADELLRFMDDEEPMPDPAIDDLITRRLEAKADLDQQQKLLDSIDERIRAYIGDRPSMKVLGSAGNLTYSTSTSQRFASTEFKKAHPDVYSQFVKESQSTRLTITPLTAAEEESSAA